MARKATFWWSAMARALPLLLVLGLVGRGHLFQGLGFAVACSHPGERSGEVDGAEQHARHDAHGITRHESAALVEAPSAPLSSMPELIPDHSGDDDCPTNCQRCPCGQIPALVANDFVDGLARHPALDGTPSWEVTSRSGQGHAQRVDRPPRALVG